MSVLEILLSTVDFGQTFFLRAEARLFASLSPIRVYRFLCCLVAVVSFRHPFVISRTTRGVCLLITVQKGG